jgi:hypothetical protein
VHDGRGGVQRGHAVCAVPAKEEVEVPLESPPILWARRSRGESLERNHQLVERIGTPPTQAFFVARAGAFSVFLPIRSMYFCWAI